MDPRRPDSDPLAELAAAGFHLPILDEPQFTQDDVLRVTGMTAGQLKGMLDRREVTLQQHNPGTGRRRMVTGGEILKFKTTLTQNEIGFPLKWAYLVADEVYHRAMFRLGGCDINAGRGALSIATYPLPDGDWARVAIWASEARPALPVRYHVLEVDRLIDETLAKLQALIKEQPIPDFEVTTEVAASPYSPTNDFFRKWIKDAVGRNVLVGLTYDETDEIGQLQELWLRQRTQQPDEQGRTKILISDEQENRLQELDDRHERARLKRLGEETEERWNRLAEEGKVRLSAMKESKAKSLFEKYSEGGGIFGRIAEGIQNIGRR